MILISHRGNLNGKSDRENQPEYINETLDQGFEVEVDVWCFGDGGYWLGHDEPQYLVKKDFLKGDGLWCHAKNIEGLYSMLKDEIHCFFHQEDDVTLTSEGYLWTYPGKQLTDKSICVMPKKVDKSIDCYAVCTDYVMRWI